MTTDTRSRPPRAERFDPATFEAKWRARWAADDVDAARDDDPRPKRYVLTMYPYPSGDLHIGHWYAAVGPDIVARLHRMRGDNVMFPMGFDSFGLPAENAAIPRGTSTPRSGRRRTSSACAASSRRWARCSTGRAR